MSRAVRKVFVELYEQGLIYRDNYIITGVTAATLLADSKSSTMILTGIFTIFAIRSKTEAVDVVVATTRPETTAGPTRL